MSAFDKLDRFHHSTPGYAVFTVVELGLAYLFITWAMDSGSWFDYLLALIFTVGFLQNLTKLIGSAMADRRRYRRLHRK